MEHKRDLGKAFSPWAIMAMMSGLYGRPSMGIRSIHPTDRPKRAKVGPRNAKALRARKKRDRQNRKRGRR